MQIEISSPHTISQPTPIQIDAAGTSLPDGDLILRCEKTNGPVPAQKSGDTITVILNNVPAGETKSFQAEENSADNAVASGVSLNEGADTLEVQLPQGSFGTYRFGEDVVRPFVWPLHGPGQIPMTRAFPVENIEGETTDHPHHTSLWSAFDEVNEVNNWHNAPGHGFTRHKSFSDLQSGSVYGGFTAHSTWESAEGNPVLDETRVLRVYNVGEDSRLFDYDITFTASYGEVHWGDTKEAGVISVRVATTMDGSRGGTITNSEGGKGESECWGKQAAWCDYTGPVNGETLGVTIYDHPNNPNFPTRWHVRDYGLFTTNPFSTECFKAGEPTPFLLPDGESVTFRYRVLLHRNDADAARVGEFFGAWTEPATGKVVS